MPFSLDTVGQASKSGVETEAHETASLRKCLCRLTYCTFIGSMGNIPPAEVLFSNGVSFAGVMAFIFSDLMVLPVLRINAAYYGWKMSLYILALLLSGLVFASLAMHYALALMDLLSDNESVRTVSEGDHFKFNYGCMLNLIFLTVSTVLVWLWWQMQQRRKEHGDSGHHHHHGGGETSTTQKVLSVLAFTAMLWLGGGLLVG